MVAMTVGDVDVGQALIWLLGFDPVGEGSALGCSEKGIDKDGVVGGGD